MTHRRNQNIGRDGTLDRLSDALSALETRIAGAQRQPASRYERQPRSEVASIREREAALRAKSARSSVPPAADFDALRDEIRAMGGASTSAGAGIRELRSDIDALKSAVTQLARQDTLVDLSDRWGVLEREIARMPDTLATRDDVGHMLARLDTLSQTISSMPQDIETRGLEERIQTLAGAMEAFGHQQAGLEKSLFDGMHDRFSAIDRALEGVAASGRGTDHDTLDRIEARIASVTRQIEDMQAAGGRDYTPQFTDIFNRLDMLQQASNGDPAVHEALTLIAERVAELQVSPSQGAAADEHEIAALSGRLDQIVELLHNSQASQGAELAAPSVKEIESRLDALTQQLSLSTENTGRSVDQAVASLEGRIADLARTLDERPVEGAPLAPLESMEERLDDIARFLTQNADNGPAVGAAGAFDTQSLELQIAELSARLAETNNAVAPQMLVDGELGTGVDVMQAARSAAEEVLSQAKLNGIASQDFERLSDDLKSLETLAREADGRNERTFEAIHDTLLKVVDHLSDLERNAPQFSETNAMSRAEAFGVAASSADEQSEFPGYQAPLVAEPQAPAIPSQAGLNAEPATSRISIDNAPSIDGPEQDEAKPELTPSQAAASAAIAAMAQSGNEADVQETAPTEKKSIFKTMTSRLRGGERAETQAELPEYDNTGSDTPLEPDTAQAEVAEIIARVRREREGGKAPAVAAAATAEAPATPKIDSTSSKSDFIAAARRAAQAAANDAQAAETRTVSKSDGLKSTVSGLLTQKRRPILIGAAAILVAMLALPFVRGLLGGGQDVAVAPPPAPAIEQSVEAVEVPDPVEPAVETVDTPELIEAPRVVEIESNVASPIEAVEEAVAQPETLAVPVQPEIAIDPTPVAAIPTDAGTPAMQDAARGGDVTAMFLVGDYFAAKAQSDGPGSAQQNNADALSWYTKSAEAGYAPAQQRLGSLYEKGVGTDKDLSLAKSWYQLAAEQGNAAAMHNLGVLHANGVDGAPNLTEAVRWFEEAALYGVPDSQYNLGVMAVRGDGMEASLKNSYKWFSLAAKNGDGDAASKRDTVAERMDPDTLKMAQDEVALWRARQTDQTANIVSVPDAWQTDQMRTAAAPPPSEPIDMQKAVRNIQAILNNNGYDAGPVDGVMGEKTRQAIRTFQADKGMEPTGEVNEELVRKLLELTA